MSAIDTRHISRDSLFLFAEIKLDGTETGERVKVRNLSAAGMMAEGGPKVQRGASIAVKLRNIGWVDGSVAWVQDNRFGIAFAEEIDPRLARQAETSASFETPRYAKPSSLLPPGTVSDPNRLRKV